jgi:hypothetical protein
MKTIKLWWPKTPLPGNFGDILSPLILKTLGYEINPATRTESNKFLAIGSITKFIKPSDTVWGSGIMRLSDPIEKKANYLAVRGPITGAKVDCSVYGDPGLLCSKLFPYTHSPVKGLGCIPHYVDYKKFDEDNQINIINGNPIEVIEECLQYEKIISSSLHGIILAHSYGIPAAWWKPSENLGGDGSKFEDYAQSVGIELIPNSGKFVLPEAETVIRIQETLLNVLSNY